MPDARPEPLSGGHTTDVVRVGDVVRRGTGPWTAAVHALLNHLEAAGFAGSPRVVGTDDEGCELLGYVPGEVGTLTPDAPLAPWFRTEEACRRVGRWIRDFQVAQAGFQPDPAHPWRRAPGGPMGEGQVVVHHDVSPYNTVRREDGSIVVLDWDFARPGTPLQDLAWAAWRWAPLMAGDWWHAEYGVDGDPAARQRANLAALLDGYGASAAQRRELGGVIGQEIAAHADDLEDMARTDPAFARLVERDYARAARGDAAWWAGDNAVRSLLG